MLPGNRVLLERWHPDNLNTEESRSAEYLLPDQENPLIDRAPVPKHYDQHHLVGTLKQNYANMIEIKP